MYPNRSRAASSRGAGRCGGHSIRCSHHAETKIGLPTVFWEGCRFSLSSGTPPKVVRKRKTGGVDSASLRAESTWRAEPAWKLVPLGVLAAQRIEAALEDAVHVRYGDPVVHDGRVARVPPRRKEVDLVEGDHAGAWPSRRTPTAARGPGRTRRGWRLPPARPRRSGAARRGPCLLLALL